MVVEDVEIARAVRLGETPDSWLDTESPREHRLERIREALEDLPRHVQAAHEAGASMIEIQVFLQHEWRLHPILVEGDRAVDGPILDYIERLVP